VPDYGSAEDRVDCLQNVRGLACLREGQSRDLCTYCGFVGVLDDGGTHVDYGG
jgi:hypothetical protein